MNNKIVLKKYVNGEETLQVFHVSDKKLQEIEDFFKSISKKKQQLKDESIEKHCKAFAEWLNINEYMLIDNIWFNLGHVTILTTQELFKLYIEQL
jgi:hypothetical protein